MLNKLYKKIQEAKFLLLYSKDMPFPGGNGDPHIEKIYATAEQMFIIATFSSAAELAATWENLNCLVAYELQSILEGDFDGLRWDIYLLLVIDNGEVSLELARAIEGDRKFFRKIVITNHDDSMLEDRLPVAFSIENDAIIENSKMFGDEHFFLHLKQCLSPQAVSRLGSSFFESEKFSEKQIRHIFVDSMEATK